MCVCVCLILCDLKTSKWGALRSILAVMSQRVKAVDEAKLSYKKKEQQVTVALGISHGSQACVAPKKLFC